jgi:cell division protein FtsI (penicillin-binding protein 3)
VTNGRPRRVKTRRTSKLASKTPSSRVTKATSSRSTKPTSSRSTTPSRASKTTPSRASKTTAPRARPSSVQPETSAEQQSRRNPIDPASRQNKLLGITLALLMVFAGRLVYVQVIAGPAIAAQALDSRLRTITEPATRGDIVDAHGVVLATSIETYRVVANQRLIAEWQATDDDGTVTAAGAAGAARLLAPYLEPINGMSAPELGARLVGDRQYVVLAKDVSPQVWDEIRELRISGITAELTADRSYPNGNTAGNVLGFVSAEGEGQAGVEQTYDALLAGVPGEVSFEVSAGLNPQPIPGTERNTVTAVTGNTLHLTIDRDIQWKAQELIDTRVAQTGATWGSVVVLDVNTGELLALVDSGAVDPNNPGATAAEDRGLRSLSAMFDPGSTAKVITMAALIEEGLADPLDQFVVPDTYTTANNQTFSDSHEHPPLNLTLNGILAESSNAGTVMVGERLTPEQRHDWFAAFGFGQPTGLGLPGESAGLLGSAESWDGRTKYAVMFGQGLSATALQAVQVFATIANEGIRIDPSIVAGTTSSDGVYTPVDPPVQTQVLSEETAQTVLTMLESVVDEGTGSLANVPGYRIAGKTGTAQVAGVGGGLRHIVGSFIGVAPAEDPQIAVGVFLMDAAGIWGGVTAAPVFSDITAFTLAKLAVPPSSTAPTLFPIYY